MPSIDDQLKDRLHGSAPQPAGADDLFLRLGARRRRRATTRKVGTVGLVVAVLAGTVGGFVALDTAFRAGPTPAAPTPSVANGALVVSIPNGDDSHLMVLPPSAQDLDPADGTSPADRGSMDLLTSEPGTRDVDPAVSPDGSTVAFVRKDASAVPPGLWLIGIDGTDERPVTRAPADVKSPAWSPDGSVIAFSAADEPEGRALYTIHPDGSDLQVVVRGQDVQDVAWSPDGGSIVYSAADIPGGSYDLWKVAIDGTDAIDLTPTASVNETDPTWSPDGSSIAFVTPDGIRQMPAGGGQSQLVVPTSPSGDNSVPTSPAWSPDGAYLSFVFEPSSVVYVLPAGATDPFPVAQGSSFAWQPVPLTSPTPSAENLGLDFQVCRVMSMPITVSGAPGTTYVFTRDSETCPKAGEGTRFVAADLNGDGLVDTAPVQLDDCFPPVGCEAFAAPDVNGDGTSEIAVSNAGADGYGVWLFALTASPPSIIPIDVVDPQGIGYLQTGRLEFAWVDVAGHAEGAQCERLPNGSTFTIFGVDKLQPKADVQRTVLQIDGSIATVVSASRERVLLSDAPVPGNELCGAALQGSAANFPNAAGTDQMDIGIGEPLCDVSRLVADFTGDGNSDTVLVGMEGRDGRCTDAAEGTEIIAIDVTGDGLRDGGYFVNAGCLLCSAYAAADLDEDGLPELIVLHQSSSTPVYELIKVVGSTPEDVSLVSIRIASNAPQMGLSAGETVTLTAGGDEGYSFAVGCEGFPTSPVLVQWSSYHPIEGPGSDVKDVYVTKLRLSAETATVVDSQHTTQPTSDPPPFDSLDSTGCGVRWFPPE
jgi:Tol biopolymer transport system component